MKKLGLFLLAIASACMFQQAFARVTIYNKTPFEIKVLVNFDWGSEDFPKGGVLGKKGAINVNAARGIMPGGSCSRKRDAAQIKRRWRVWVNYGENNWKKELDKRWTQTGAFSRADVFMTTDKHGVNKFDISVGSK